MAVTGTKIVTVTFNGTRNANTRKLFQYDYGQSYYFKDLELPEVFEVHFSNKPKDGKAKTMIGQNQYVDIPDEYLTTGLPVYAWIFLHNGSTDGETRYTIQTGVTPKSKLENAEPTPVQQDTITRTIAVLNEAVDKSEQSAEDSEAWAVGQRDGVDVETGDETYHNNSKYYSDLSKGASESAETSATNAHTSELNAHASEQNAYSYIGRSETAATNAEASKNAANQSAISADRSARDASASEVNAAQSAASANEAQRDAMNYSTRAETAERNASASATQAGQSASNANRYADNAQASATDSANSASEAEGYKDSASASASQASTKATEASNSATSAQQSATSAANSASEAATSASVANDAKTAAETAQGKAEDAITEAIATLNDGVAKSETNVTHYPRIIDGYWNVWDAQTEQFVTTGVEAQGEKGDGGLCIFLDRTGSPIPTDADKHLPASATVTCGVYCFKGGERIDPENVTASAFQYKSGQYSASLPAIITHNTAEAAQWRVTYNLNASNNITLLGDSGSQLINVTVDGEVHKIYYPWFAAKQGETGEGGLSILIGQSGVLFPTNAEKTFTANYDTGAIPIRAVKGTEFIDIDSVDAISSIEFTRNGSLRILAPTIGFNPSDHTRYTVSHQFLAGDIFSNESGVIKVRITIDGVAYDRTIPWTLSKQGEAGADAVNVFLRDPVTLVPTDADGYHANQQIVSTYVYAFKNGEPCTITSVTATPVTVQHDPLHLEGIDAVVTVSGTSALVKYTLPAGTGLRNDRQIPTITAVVDGESHNATMCIASTRQGDNYVLTEQDKEEIAGMVDVSGFYTKPSDGIPKSDLASAVQTSLNKADSALQTFIETDPTVPSWAKASAKPSYTASEVGAIVEPSNPTTGAFLVYDGTEWVAQTLSIWQGGNY